MDRLELLEQLFNVIRNLVCGSLSEMEMVLAKYESVLELVFHHLEVFSNINSMEAIHVRVLVQIIYVLVNLSAGDVKYKRMVMRSDRVDNLKKLLCLKSKEMHAAIVWLIINLTWKDDEEYLERVKIFVERGFREWLSNLGSKNPRIADKVGTALENLC
jgi:hypothetical protein